MQLAAPLALAAAAWIGGGEDIVVLPDGRLYEGVRVERNADVLTVHFEHGSVDVREDQVADYTLATGPDRNELTEEERAKLDEGLVRFGGKWMTPPKRDRAVAELSKAQAERATELRESRLWRNRRTAESKYIEYEYTVPEEIFEAYRDRMDAYYAYFHKLWRIKRGDTGKLSVRFYNDRELFTEMGTKSSSTLAFFEWTKPPYRLQFYYDALDPEGTQQVVFHEFGHYLQRMLNQEISIGHWPGESLAEYFSTGSWDPKRKKYEASADVLESRLVSIQRDMEEGEFVTIEAMIREGNGRNFHDYTWGWSLIHFLMSDRKTAKPFEKYFMGLFKDDRVDRTQKTYSNVRYKEASGETMLQGFKDALRIKSDEDLEDLQKRWYAYIQELPITSSKGLARAADDARRHGYKFRAKRLYQEAIDAGDAVSRVHHNFARLLASMDEPKAAWEQWHRAIAMDPFVASYHIGLGYSMLTDGGDKDAAKAILRLAQEIEPDNVYLDRNLEELLKK